MIELLNVSKSFDRKLVLNRLSIELSAGKTTCVLGPSGCGKTTLMQVASGLSKPDRGRVNIDAAARLSFLFQEDRLLPWEDCLGNITVTGVSAARAAEYLAEVGLSDEEHTRPGTLSGGMRRRLAIARMLAFGGDCYFADEPLQGLDVETAELILRLIKRELMGKTALVITHNPEEALALGDEIILVDGPPIQIRRRFERKEFESSAALRAELLRIGPDSPQ